MGENLGNYVIFTMNSFTDFSFSIRDKQIGVFCFQQNVALSAFPFFPTFLIFPHLFSVCLILFFFFFITLTESVERMLHLHANASQASSEYWKVVVFDDYCCDVLALLLRKGEFRNNGVTLTLYFVITVSLL